MRRSAGWPVCSSRVAAPLVRAPLVRTLLLGAWLAACGTDAVSPLRPDAGPGIDAVEDARDDVAPPMDAMPDSPPSDPDVQPVDAGGDSGDDALSDANAAQDVAEDAIVDGADADATGADGGSDAHDADGDAHDDATPADAAMDSADDGDASDAEDVDDTSPDADVDGGEEPALPWTFVRPTRRVGIFYLAWHTYAATAMRAVPAEERLSVDELIRLGDRPLSSMLLDRGLFDAAAAFHWHVTPEPGYYCLYRARAGDPAPGAPDCPGIPALAATHARQLWDAGVDFVFADLTNLPEDNAFADVLGVRPVEVLFEEWAALRAAGTPTPDIALWFPATEAQGAERPLFRRLIPLLEDPRYADLHVRHAPTGEPIVFVVDQPGLPASPRFLTELQGAGLRPVRLWGNLPDATLAAGTAAWMQPCREEGAFTTLLRPDRPCNQSWSPSTPIGSVVSVSASYQIGYASLPWQASGRQGGLTLQKQFETAFAAQPDWLLINAWNEHVAQPQANPLAEALGPLRQSMGMTWVPSTNASAPWLWVDAYGHDLSRDLEPTLEHGRGDYDLLRSCLRTYRMGANPCASEAGAAEACCDLAPGLNLVRVLRQGNAGSAAAWATQNHVPTLSRVERDALVGSGAFTEVCNVAYGPPTICGDATTPNLPFLLHAAGGPRRQVVMRCLKPDARHLISTDPNCEGLTVEGPLGFASMDRSSETPRALRRCRNDAAGQHLHVIDVPCPAGLVDEGVLGFVR